MSDRDGRDPTRLGAADKPDLGTSCLEAHLGDLGALAAARLSADDDDAVVLDSPYDLAPMSRDRQLFRIAEVDRPRRFHVPYFIKLAVPFTLKLCCRRWILAEHVIFNAFNMLTFLRDGISL